MSVRCTVGGAQRGADQIASNLLGRRILNLECQFTKCRCHVQRFLEVHYLTEARSRSILDSPDAWPTDNEIYARARLRDVAQRDN